MKIKAITVEKLFDTFDHNISLKTEEKITLMLGENGFGKTIILEMINALFNKNLFYFQTVVFKSFQIKFEDNLVWEITKSPLTLSEFENHAPKKPVIEILCASAPLRLCVKI